MNSDFRIFELAQQYNSVSAILQLAANGNAHGKDTEDVLRQAIRNYLSCLCIGTYDHENFRCCIPDDYGLSGLPFVSFPNITCINHMTGEGVITIMYGQDQNNSVDLDDMNTAKQVWLVKKLNEK